LAAESTVFEQAFAAAPWTVPAVASILTGLRPGQHQVNRKHPFLEGTYSTLPEVLHRRGYQTLGVSTNPWISGDTRHSRGFEVFWQAWQVLQSATDLSARHLRLQGLEGAKGAALWESLKLNPIPTLVNGFYKKFLHFRWDYGTRRATALAQSLIRQRDRQRPFFLFLFYLEPHLRFMPPPGYRERFLPPGVTARQARQVNQDSWAYIAGKVSLGDQDFEILRALYDAEICYLDENLGQFTAFLQEEGVGHNTVLVITADHGENLGDHGLMNHQYGLYDTLLHVPLIIRYPPAFAAGERVTGLVQTTDLFTTFLDLLDERDPVLRQQVAGTHSLLPEKLVQSPRTHVWAEYPEPQPPIAVLEKRFPGCNLRHLDRSLAAVRTATHKFIWASDGQHEFYDLRADPEERRNLFGVPSPESAALAALLQKHLTSSATPSPEESEIEPHTLHLLEGLGYL